MALFYGFLLLFGSEARALVAGMGVGWRGEVVGGGGWGCGFGFGGVGAAEVVAGEECAG